MDLNQSQQHKKEEGIKKDTKNASNNNRAHESGSYKYNDVTFVLIDLWTSCGLGQRIAELLIPFRGSIFQIYHSIGCLYRANNTFSFDGNNICTDLFLARRI